MATYWDVYLAHKAAAFQAYGGSKASPDVSGRYLVALHDSWSKIFAVTWKDNGGAYIFGFPTLPAGLGSDIASSNVRLPSLLDAWNKWKTMYDAADKSADIIGGIPVWDALGGLASQITDTPLSQTAEQAAEEWRNDYVWKPLAAGAEGVLDVLETGTLLVAVLVLLAVVVALD